MTAGLSPLFAPGAVVVVGASTNPGKLGAAMARSLSTFPGPVLLVNSRNPDPAAGIYAGVAEAVAATGTVPDLAVFCVPAGATPSAVAEAAGAGVRAGVVCAGGFREAGPSGTGIDAELTAAVAATGIRLVGPNTSGFLAPPRRLVASFVPGAGEVPAGSVGVVASSGGMLHALAFLLAAEGLGLALGVGIGNGLDVSTADVCRHLTNDADVRAVALHVEGLADGRALTDAVARLAERVPVAALVVGRGDVGELARSHTGVLTPSWRTTRAALRQAGAVLVDDERELVDAVAALSRTRLPATGSPGIGIVSGQAGPMVLLTDRLRSTGLAVPPLDDGTVARLAELLPPLTYQSNPVDTGRPGDTFTEVVATVASAAAVDVLAVIGLLEPDAFDLSAAVRSVAAGSDVPVVAVVGGPPAAVADTRAALAGGGVAAYAAVAGAVTGLRALADDARGRADRAEDADPVRLVVPDSFRIPAGEDEGKDLLDWLGLATPGRLACDDRTQAQSARRLLRPPLAVKMLEPVVAHKRRVGGVHLGVVGEADMDAAVDALDRAGARRYLVEEMAGPGVDLIVGARRDPVFGPVVVVGLGGDEAEALDAVAVRLAPLSEREAAAMLAELPGAGRPGGWSDRVERRSVATVVATLGALLVAVPDLD
ncbi:MAG TPA: acetate--CoA ligase family protein, partial [Acidimicrobiia bacterium]|nr:acetate--CoA ligase family protein [Acidimicrobiia bacterium]